MVTKGTERGKGNGNGNVEEKKRGKTRKGGEDNNLWSLCPADGFDAQRDLSGRVLGPNDRIHAGLIYHIW
jgi:hypothetical protein